MDKICYNCKHFRNSVRITDGTTARTCHAYCFLKHSETQRNNICESFSEMTK